MYVRMYVHLYIDMAHVLPLTLEQLSIMELI